VKPFKHVNATTVSDAVSLCQKYDGKAKFIAGGTDLLGLLKDRVLPTYPEAVINIKTIPGMNYIKEEAGGLRIGALTELRDIANSEALKGMYNALAEGALSVGSPHVGRMGTIGGNLCQSVRCWYYRSSPWTGAPFDCLRKGGKLCYAVVGDNRYHSIFGGPKGCFAVFPSDIAPALIALNAMFKTSKRTIESQDFFDALTGTILDRDEILTEIQVPAPIAGTRSTYIKFSVRKALDFSIVSVASVLTVEDGVCKGARIVLGGVAPVPWRATAAEAAMEGSAINQPNARVAATAAVSDAQPSEKNKWKVEEAKVCVERAIMACK